MAKLTDLPSQVANKVQETLEKSVGKYVDRGAAELHYARKMFEAGALKLESPQHIAAMLADIVRWGEIGMVPALNARRTPHRTAVIDDDGDITFQEFDDAVNATANALRAKGIQAGEGVAILARNHRWFLISVYGAARVGARIILMNTEFSGPQIKEVSEREGAQLGIGGAGQGAQRVFVKRAVCRTEKAGRRHLVGGDQSVTIEINGSAGCRILAGVAQVDRWQHCDRRGQGSKR